MIHFWKRLFEGLIFVEKEIGVNVQCMLEMSRVYTLAEIFSKIEGKFGTLFMIMIKQINDLMPTYFLLKYIERSLLA